MIEAGDRCEVFVLDGDVHHRGAPDHCGSYACSAEAPCRHCGGDVHYQPIYGGYIRKCAQCGQDLT